MNKYMLLAVALLTVSINAMDSNTMATDQKVEPSQNLISLMNAIGYGKISTVKILLSEDNSDINAQFYGDMTPLILAATRGYTGLVEFLLSVPNIDVNGMDKSGRTALDVVRFKSDEKLLQKAGAQSGKNISRKE